MKEHWFRGVDRLPFGQVNAHSKIASAQGRRSASNSGFTLVELLIVVTILPIIVGAISAGLLSVFSLQSGVSNRLADTGDAQVVAANYQNDVQSALNITTQSSSTPQCGTGTQLLGMEWDLNVTTGNFQTVVSYVTVPLTSGSSTRYSLVRQYCTGGSMTPVGTSTISYDLPGSQSAPFVSSQPAPTVDCNVANCSVSTQWISTRGVTDVKFSVTEPKSSYTFNLTSVPAASMTAGAIGAPISPNTTANCNFASPGSGTYSGSLCFVDFSSLSNSQNMYEATHGCLEMSVGLPENYSMYFCLSITGVTVSPHSFPTYPEAFLGNSIGGTPFYIGVQGQPALYETTGGTATVTISNITVVNPQGISATGWEAVGADAETTDPGESISWTSDQNLNLLPNTVASPEGDACDAPASGNPSNPGPGGTLLTGIGTQSVACTSTWQATVARTGTVMVWAATPKTMTTTLTGSGLEAMAFGLLLS